MAPIDGMAVDNEFRRRVQEWLGPALQRFWTDHDPGTLTPAELGLAWERQAYADGWGAPGWPVEYGGMGLSLIQQIVYYEELARKGAPEETNRPAKRTFAPTLMQHGTDDQKDRYLTRILSAQAVWCQGFSEPGAGSDLAAISTEARIEGDSLRINGQKTWSSNADIAQHMFAVVRTEPGSRRHNGLSLVIVDMDLPGVEVRPITKITGDRDFAEVFLTDVIIPVDHVVGPLGQGWTVAMGALANERSINIVPRVADFVRHVGEAMAGLDPVGSPSLRADLVHAQDLGVVLTVACYRAVVADPAVAAVHGSLLKLAWSEASQAFLRAVMDAYACEPDLPRDAADVWERRYLASRAQTIYAGTSEIQRNVIAKRGLGLPEPARGQGGSPCGWL